MASLLVKQVASKLLTLRKIASSSRVFSTKGYKFVQHDTKDECILKCEDSLVSSVARGVINGAFSPHVPPTENLARLLNFSDLRISFFHETRLFPRWTVVEDLKGLYILHDITEKDIESVKEFMTGNHEEKFNEPVPVSEEDLLPILDFMRGDGYAPTGDYYYHVMKDDKEVEQFVESVYGSPDNFKALIEVHAVSQKPQAVYVFVVLGNPQTRDPYGGYAMEIFLDNSLYNVFGTKGEFTGVNKKLLIPKKKVEWAKSIGGNLIFFQEKKFIKPTRWRPT